MSKRTCSECDAVARCRGMCSYHYGVAYRAGLPSYERPSKLSNVDRETGYGDCARCERRVSIYFRPPTGRPECRGCKARSRGQNCPGRPGKKVAPPTKEQARAYRMKYKYGLSYEEYQIMVESQGNLCLICAAPPGKLPLVVDHDHESGMVRGLLCTPCNKALGFFRDDHKRIARAAKYLARFAA